MNNHVWCIMKITANDQFYGTITLKPNYIMLQKFKDLLQNIILVK